MDIDKLITINITAIMKTAYKRNLRAFIGNFYLLNHFNIMSAHNTIIHFSILDLKRVTDKNYLLMCAHIKYFKNNLDDRNITHIARFEDDTDVLLAWKSDPLFEENARNSEGACLHVIWKWR